ncbi:ATP-binding protein [Acidovorax sp. PRC11]|uniref:hybrid sensor histidine kinase/response regulator n=1 Tax=Acidovorax sp. PRC11 TaxID=2962592 RepID=UPI0028822B8F|nr:ATP-binding protein [Acidovorax sp. PRC11]MDT0140711.1 histidine kinase [Acidovorax sp. PRC11]
MASGVTVKPLRILHLEDSPADHALACITLRRANGMYEIRHADTMETFTAWLDAERFDLVLADYRLPGFTALDAWRIVSARADAPPFVLLSGAIGEAAAVDAIRLGMADYLLKDDMGRLPHVIDRAIEVHEARRARKQAVRELAASERRLAELTEHLQTSIEKERAAIAREIHDDIGGALTAVRFDVEWIRRHASEEPVRRHAGDATEMLQHAIGASQRIMMDLRPPILDQGLVAAVQWLAESFERRTGIPTRVHAGRDTIAVPADVQLVAYRTAQEALTNVSKYAEAGQVAIDLSDSEGVLTLEVTDNGRGIEPAMRNKPKSFGLKGLEERARTVGGWLDISSQPGRGTSVIVSIPLGPAEGRDAADGGEMP